jgi:membrane-associated phospholipid phosphatase
VLYAWALWPARWLRPILVLANAAMLAATPIDGGHYFVDLFAGMAIAIAAIAAARRVGQIIADRHAGRMLPVPRVGVVAAE